MRFAEKHSLPLEDDPNLSKRPRLTILPQQQQVPVVKSIMSNTAGGIMTVSKSIPVNPAGLLQIAKPGLNSGGTATTTLTTVPASSTSIPGIPVPSMAGVLTGIKSIPGTQALFSLPGKRIDLTCEKVPNENEAKLAHVPGMPGPSREQGTTVIHPLKSEVKIEVNSPNLAKEEGKFLRPNSLPLTPGSFKTKKHVMLTAGDTLVSPETPRPRKSYMLQYQNGTAYTTLGFKSSTKVYYTTIFHQQPMYVPNKPRISMYSNWRVVTKVSLDIFYFERLVTSMHFPS